MQTIDLKKLKIIVALVAAAAVLLLAYVAFGDKGRKPTKDETPVLQMAPENIMNSTVFMKTLDKSGAMYWISEDGEVMIRDAKGNEYAISPDGKFYRVSKDGTRVPVDATEEDFIMTAMDEASLTSGYVQSVKEGVRTRAADKQDGENPMDALLAKEGFNVSGEEFAEMLAGRGVTTDDFLKLTEEKGFGKAVNSVLQPVESSNSRASDNETAKPKAGGDDPIVKHITPNDNDKAGTGEPAGVRKERSQPYEPALLKSLGTDKYGTQNAQSDKADFAANYRGESGYEFLGENDIAPGTIIPITLITGLNSDLPGEITGQVSSNVYDTLSHENLLIPKGTRLMASYDSRITWGQNRVIVAWTRLIRSDGLMLRMPGFQGVDNLGRTGYDGDADRHFDAVLKSAGLSSLIDVTAAAVNSMTDSDAVSAIVRAISSSASDIGKDLTEKAVNRQPTITVPPGSSARLLVNEKLTLPPMRETN